MTNAVREADGRTGLHTPDLGFSVARFTGSVPWNEPLPALKCWAIFKIVRLADVNDKLLYE